MNFFLVLFLIVVGGGSVLAFTNTGTGKNKSWSQFYSQGKELGFSSKEVELLRYLATKANVDDPAALFVSQHQMDLCISYLRKNMHSFGNDQENNDFLSKLYDFRKKIEMDAPKAKRGIFNSRQMTEGQNLRILMKGLGVFKSQVVKNSNQYLTISRPIAPGQPPGTFSWIGQQISVYFWREDDAGYVFDTSVMDEVFTNKGLAAIRVGHSDQLFRTQKRKSIRVKLHKPAFLYPLTEGRDPNRIEENPGLKCFLEDLSDTGCAITVGGEADQGLRIKVQFVLDNNPIVMGGTVRSLEYKKEANRSLLHVEADPLPIDTRNKILGEVFGMLSETEEEDLPFRVLSEEIEAMTEQQNSTEEKPEEKTDVEKPGVEIRDDIFMGK